MFHDKKKKKTCGNQSKTRNLPGFKIVKHWTTKVNIDTRRTESHTLTIAAIVHCPLTNQWLHTGLWGLFLEGHQMARHYCLGKQSDFFWFLAGLNIFDRPVTMFCSSWYTVYLDIHVHVNAWISMACKCIFGNVTF